MKISYVQSSYTYSRAVIRQEDLTEGLKLELIKVMLAIKDNSIMLHSIAKKRLFNQSDLENVDTCSNKFLLIYKVVEVKGKSFLEEFAQELNEKLDKVK